MEFITFIISLLSKLEAMPVTRDLILQTANSSHAPMHGKNSPSDPT